MFFLILPLHSFLPLVVCEKSFAAHNPPKKGQFIKVKNGLQDENKNESLQQG